MTIHRISDLNDDDEKTGYSLGYSAALHDIGRYLTDQIRSSATVKHRWLDDLAFAMQRIAADDWEERQGEVLIVAERHEVWTRRILDDPHVLHHLNEYVARISPGMESQGWTR